MNNYILDGQGVPQVEHDFEKWARWYAENPDARHIARTELDGDVMVSTVFLGIDHNWGYGPPILYETMVFGGPHDGIQERHFTREQAIAAHDQIVANLRQVEPLPGVS